jgi:hypothetical protein
MSRLTPIGAIACGLIATVLLQGCERPPIKSTQNGYRGTAMVQVVNPRTAGGSGLAPDLPAACRPCRTKARGRARCVQERARCWVT